NQSNNYFHPFTPSKQFTILPTSQSYLKQNHNQFSIQLHPPIPFPTPHHPTTTISLKPIQTFLKPTHSLIHLPTPSAILTIPTHLLRVQTINPLD
ncbi:50S ribosomal protein L11 methyltransferase, partial [Staphylococcus epidermidis]|uniref:50S ribosomal protein L11 methyltransferase n=1 Tax=Staphylococcus epidermidis TaxID=1282 RepID=UPI0016427210